ncbi:flagellar protein FlaG [Undibacterium sp. Jales W-56]|uniref:flagellar protein FlaG n=1 Tax=Undibacterium sp. Jales W-56 TaxID=2897325 RepID=UPI0021D2ACB1|nr:flagellar protein FlaG [Undibacterium sp. Jales W-56]MCU6435378.1 flagellar protein FlaG [Undibacterium sp. Jales W-56]
MDITSIGNSNQTTSLLTGKPASSDSSVPVKQTASPATIDSLPAQVDKNPGIAQLTKAIQDINKTVQAISQGVEFTLDDDNKRIVVKVVDQQTKQVLRQIPTEEALEISKSLDKLQGLLIHQQA